MWNNCFLQLQDKGPRLVILSNEVYCSKVTTQIERGSFITVPSEVTKSLEKKVEDFIENGKTLKFLIKIVRL